MNTTERGRIEWIHKNLLTEWSRHATRNATTLHAIRQLLQQLERELLQCDSERNDLRSTDREKATSVVYKDFLEIAVFHTALTGDIARFEECIARVEDFYKLTGYESVSRQLTHGLHLMHLLSSGKTVQFHTLIEKIDPHLRENDPFLSVPTKLEQYIAEGAYDKLLRNEKVIPSMLYAPFMETLISAVRKEIAACVEKSHNGIGMDVTNAARKLLFRRRNDFVDFATKRGWSVVNDRIYFQRCCENADDVSQATSACVGTERLVKQLTFYAKQLEMIV